MRQLHRASRLLYASAVVLGVVVALLLVARFANTTATVRARRVAVHRSGTSRTTQNRVAVSRFTAGGEAQQRAAFIPAASLSLPDVDVEDTEDEWTDGDALGDAPAASPSCMREMSRLSPGTTS